MFLGENKLRNEFLDKKKPALIFNHLSSIWELGKQTTSYFFFLLDKKAKNNFLCKSK